MQCPYYPVEYPRHKRCCVVPLLPARLAIEELLRRVAGAPPVLLRDEDAGRVALGPAHTLTAGGVPLGVE